MGISLLLVLVELPLSAVSHARAVDVGLATQDWLPWLGDIAKSAGIDAVFAAAGGALALALIRRFRRNWWAPAAVVIVAFGVVTIWLFPIVIDPLFNRFEPLRPGPTRSDVLELADEAGVDVGEVYRVDASRRTTAANAYVVGLGKTKRVVLYDNLISAFPRDQMRLVVAHELGHQKHNDLTRGLVWLALVAPAGTFLAQALAERFARREGLADESRKPGPIVLPAVALSLAIVSFGLGAASNVLSRQVEARADAFSLRLTDDPAAFVQLERRLALRNISDPDPPRSCTRCSAHTRPRPSASGSARRSTCRGEMGRRELIERVVRELSSYERPSASEGERRAADWLAAEFRAAGARTVRIEEESAHGGYWWPLGLPNAAALLASRSRRLGTLVGGLAAAAVYDDVSGGRLWFRRHLLPKRSTYNVIAEAGDPDADRTVVFISHHDAAHWGSCSIPGCRASR